MTTSGDIDVPKVGPMNKKVVIGVGVAGAAFLGWRYYQSRQAAAAAPAASTDGTYADDGTLPAVDTSGTAYGAYGYPDAGTTTTGTVDDYGFTGTTNDQWTQYASTQLEQSASWSYTDILTALGNYLAGRSLTDSQVQIVQAAIAVAGYPPVGNHSIVSGGNTPIIVAPSGVRSTSVTSTSVTLAWNSVPGASGYHLYKNGTAVGDTGTASGTVTALAAGTSYSLAVAAYDMSGNAGPLSSAITVKTSAAATTTPPPVKTPPVKGKPVPTPAKKYPTWKGWHTVLPRENYSTIATKEKTGLSGAELYAYQLTSNSKHSAAAIAKLRKQGQNLILAGQEIAIPYPK